MVERQFISVIICTFKRPLFLEKCIRSILSNNYEDYEIIVVGQGADETPKKIIDRFFADNQKINYVHTDIVGLSHARNMGSEIAKGDIVAFIDDDAAATCEWLAGYAEAFQNIDPVPAMVGGMIEPDWETPKPAWYPEQREFLLGIYNIGDTMKPFPEADLPIGANFAVLRKIVMEMEGFDTQVGFDSSRKKPMIAGEDSLLGLKVRAAGYPIYYQPKAKVLHHVNATKLSRRYFLKRHFWEGVTHMVLEDRNVTATRRRMKANFVWHFMRTMVKVGEFLTTFVPIKKNSPASRMLKASEIAYSLGVCKESFRLMLRGQRSD